MIAKVFIFFLMVIPLCSIGSEYSCSHDYIDALKNGEEWVKYCKVQISDADFIIAFPDGDLKDRIATGLISSIPSGNRIELISVDYDRENEIVVRGIEKSDASVARFMRNIESLGVFEAIEWKTANIKRDSYDNSQFIEFSLHLTLKGR